MKPENALVVFEGKNIRRIWHNDEWYFSIIDIVAVLTDSKDPKQYINKMRKRDEELSKGGVQFVHTDSLDLIPKFKERLSSIIEGSCEGWGIGIH